MKLKWKLTGFYLGLCTLALFLAGVGVMVETKGLNGLSLLIIFSIAVILTTPLAYFLARSFNKRIDELNLRIKSLTTGANAPGKLLEIGDELGELSENVYQLSRRLQSKISEATSESTKTLAILSSMLEGVVVLDNIGRIVLLNRSAESMLECEEGKVKLSYITDLFRDAGLEEPLQLVLDQQEAVRHEFVFSGRMLLSLMSPIIAGGVLYGVVAVFQDLTEIRRLEKMRTEFVANVSHELRTPLTSIKGFVETLLDGAAEDPRVRERFLNIILDETRRLQRLIEDLLALSNLEDKRKSFEGSSSALAAYSRVSEFLERLAKAKHIKLESRITADLAFVEMGEELLSQVYLNLLENGIKYTPPGGSVWLNIDQAANEIIIEIGDTGPGIPQESLPRIFERFYRVDRARSREAGGTGLGLSIVKHIVEQANGRVQVQSELGRGTVFKVWIPIQPGGKSVNED